MFENDYVMRLIKEMVRAILKLVFNIDTESPTAELLKSTQDKETLENLLDMIDAGDINEAENRIYDLMSDGRQNGLQIALLFYSYLNDKSDEFLENHDFSREEVKSGIQRVADSFGLSSMVSIFLSE